MDVRQTEQEPTPTPLQEETTIAKWILIVIIAASVVVLGSIMLILMYRATSERRELAKLYDHNRVWQACAIIQLSPSRSKYSITAMKLVGCKIVWLQ